jgi:hypothetical protein
MSTLVFEPVVSYAPDLNVAVTGDARFSSNLILPVCPYSARLPVFPSARLPACPPARSPMYSTCLFCNQALGSNEVVEAFPVGRRLAFDQRRGRLWVVCRKCAKWNLTPLEERWEAIESCERLFRDTRKRTSTENIGLAKLSEGLELIRIGEPLRPEFAAWRYGAQFGRRYRRWMTGIIGGSAVYGGAISAGIVGIAAGSVLLTFWMVVHTGRDVIRDRRVVARIPDESGAIQRVRVSDAFGTAIVPGDERYSWALRLRVGLRKRELLVKGDEARHVAAKVVPHINLVGGSQKAVAEAVSSIEESGTAEAYLAWVARYHETSSFMRHQWLGVEMAVNEENERRALEDELSILEAAWKEAEEIASISDRLVFPSDLEARLAELKKKTN